MNTSNPGKAVEFYFDFGSPTTYLAHTQLPRIAAETGASLVYRPMLLGGVFKATGNASPVTVPAKGRWMGDDMARWAQRHGVPFAFNPYFPINTLTLMRGAVGLQMRRPEAFGPYVDAVFKALWVQSRDLGQPAEVAALLAGLGIAPEDFMALVGDAEVKAALIAATEQAVARGVFGAPTCFVAGQMHFGQDRLDFVRDALAAGVQPGSPVAPVQRQLDAYNARDLAAFVACYAEDVQLLRPPAAEPVMVGKAALAAHYAAYRFNLPALHAELLNRMVFGNKVIDHERISGVRDAPYEAAVVYEVAAGLISKVWLYNPE